MDKGLLTYARDVLVKGWKANTSGVAMGNIPVSGLAFNGEVLVSGNPAQALKAFKGIVYSCTDLRGIGVAKTPWRVYHAKNSREKSIYKRTRIRELSHKQQDEIIAKAQPGTQLSMAEGVEEVLNGPYVDLLRYVNDYTNSFDLKKLTSLYLDLLGDCYWILIRNKLGKPVNIWVAPSEYMKPIADSDVFISGYKYKRGMTEIIYPKEDVIHHKYATPLNQFVGMAPLAAVIDAYNLREYMFNFEKEMFKTGGNPKIIVFTKQPVTKDEAEGIKDRWKHTEDGGIMVTYGGDFEVHESQSLNARDMGYREGIALTRDEIAAAYHVPKSMLTADDVNLATATAQKFFLAEYATSPSCIQIDQKMNEQLSWQFNESLFVLFDDPVPENGEEIREDRKVNMQFNITTINEERGMMGLEPVEWGDAPQQQQQGALDTDENAERALALMARMKKLRGA